MPKCGKPGCDREFSSAVALKKHYMRDHNADSSKTKTATAAKSRTAKPKVSVPAMPDDPDAVANKPTPEEDKIVEQLKASLAETVPQSDDDKEDNDQETKKVTSKKIKKPAASEKEALVLPESISAGISDPKVLTTMTALIPPAEFYDTYQSRAIMGYRDIDLYSYAREVNWNLLLYGPTGPGKTSSLLAYCHKERLPMYPISCNGAAEPSHFIGRWIPDETGGLRWQDGPLTMLVRYGGVCLLSEVNFMPPRIAAVLYSILDKRRNLQLVEKDGEVVTAHPDFQIVADMNPDYAGTRPLNKAFRNRFPLQIKWDYDPVVESQLVIGDKLLEIARQLRARHAAGDIETPISTNMLQEFELVMADVSLAFAILNFVSHFDEDEQKVVKEVFTLNEDNLRREYTDRGVDVDGE